jgi:hypothetical protein
LDEEIPDSYVSYFTKFLDSLTSRFAGSLHRYITPAESVYWVAFDGFHLGRVYRKKVSMTLSPVLYTWSLASWKQRYAWIELTGDFHDWAKAVPYTWTIDPLCSDPVYVYEFEMAVYAEDYKLRVQEKYPWLTEEKLQDYLIVPIEDISMARLIPEALEEGLNEKDYFKLKILPGYIHEGVYKRSPYRMMPRRLLIQQLAIVTVTRKDPKLRYATSIAWDKYWEPKGMLSYPPRYDRALEEYDKWSFTYNYELNDIENVCISSFVPLNVCWEIVDEIVDEIQSIYGFFNVTVRYTDRRMPSVAQAVEEATVSSQALELYTGFPKLFRAPAEAEHFLKWWHASYDEAFKYLEDLLKNERMYRRIRLRDDPEVVEG